MKKIFANGQIHAKAGFLLFICITIVEFTYAQNYFINGGTDNNWGTPNNWSNGFVPSSTGNAVFDVNSPNCTLNASDRVCGTFSVTSTYTNTITFTKALTVSGSITLGANMVIAGPSGLTAAATGTLTSNGKTWPNALTLNGSSATYTLGDNWTVNGTFTSDGGTNTMNGFTLTIGGGLSVTNTPVGLAGSTNFILNGGTWSGNNGFKCNLELKPTGTNTITVSGSVIYNTGTLAYTGPGTVTATGSTLTINNTATLNTNGITWNNVSFTAGANITATISSDLDVNGTLTTSGSNAITFNTGTINAKGNITVNNTSTGGGGSATVEVNGGANQTLAGSGTAGTGRLPNVTVNKSGGTLSLASIISVDRNWTYTAGTVAAGTSVVAFTGSYNTDGEGTSSTMSFYDVYIFAGTRTLTGAFDVDHDILIYSGATLEQNSTTPRPIFIGRDWTDNGTYNTRNAMVTFDGNVTGALSKSSGTETFNRMKVNKSSGLLQFSSTNVVINDSLHLVSGKIFVQLSTNYVKLIDNAIAVGGSSNSYIEGYCRKVGDDAFTFPMGMGTSNYHPIGISAPGATTDEFETKFFGTSTSFNPKNAYGTGTDNTITNIDTVEYWTLTRNAGTSDVQVTLQWNTNSVNISGSSNQVVMGWKPSSSQWINHGNGGVTGNPTVGRVKTCGPVSTYSAFAIAQCSTSNCGNPSVSISSSTTLCAAGSVTLTASGGDTYSWSTGATTTSITVNATSAACYTVTGTNYYGCSASPVVCVNTDCPDFMHWDCMIHMDTAVFASNPGITAFGFKAYEYSTNNGTCSGSLTNSYNTSLTTTYTTPLNFANALSSLVLQLPSNHKAINVWSNYGLSAWMASLNNNLDYKFELWNTTGSPVLVGSDCITVPTGCGTFATRFAEAAAAANSAAVAEVYPNPAMNSINVKAGQDEEEKAIFELYNVLGEKVILQQLTDNQNQISLVGMNAGVYLYKVKINGTVKQENKIAIIR